MSEPRYDFCLVVVRKYTGMGYPLVGISPVYTPDIPQSDHARRIYINPKKFFIPSIQESLYQEYTCRSMVFTRTHHFLRATYGIGTMVAWGVVPVLGAATPPRVITETFKTSQSHSLITRRFIVDHDLQAWFKKLCDVLHEQKGGKYIITSVRTPEVPRFAL